MSDWQQSLSIEVELRIRMDSENQRISPEIPRILKGGPAMRDDSSHYTLMPSKVTWKIF